MPTYIAAYDLRAVNASPHASFTKHAATKGWTTQLTVQGGAKRHLPNTTLYGTFDDIDAADRALEAARAATATELKVSVYMPRYYIAPVGAGRIKDVPNEGLPGLRV